MTGWQDSEFWVLVLVQWRFVSYVRFLVHEIHILYSQRSVCMHPLKTDMSLHCGSKAVGFVM